jgi:hypothetical protein
MDLKFLIPDFAQCVLMGLLKPMPSDPTAQDALEITMKLLQVVVCAVRTAVLFLI